MEVIANHLQDEMEACAWLHQINARNLSHASHSIKNVTFNLANTYWFNVRGMIIGLIKYLNGIVESRYIFIRIMTFIKTQISPFLTAEAILLNLLVA